jgi:hypothetical protein
VPLKDGNLFLQAAVPTRSKAGFLLHLLGPSGRMDQSFYNAGTAWRLRRPWSTSALVARADSQSIWLVRPNQYTVERWNEKGEATDRLIRSANWFAPWDSADMDFFRSPPPPTVISISQDSLGILWVMSHIAGKQWQANGRGADKRERNRDITIPDLDDAFDTVLDAIDPLAGKLLISRRFDGSLLTLLPGGFAGRLRQASDGRAYYEISQVRLAK